MKNSKISSQLFFGFLVLLSCSTANAQITPSGDAYTNTASPSTNFGTKTLLDVQSASQTSYIQFDLSSIPAGYTGANVAKASLKLYVNAVTTAGSFNVNFVNGTWSEKTITANMAPALGATIAASVPLTTANKNDYIIIDVTSAVGAWLDGSQANDGIALVANSPLNASFDSKENTTNSQTAELDIVLTGTGAGTITGVTTANGSGLTGGGTKGTLALSLTNTCAANQTLQWNGSAWVCASAGAGTITGVTAGTDLTGGGSSGNVTLNLNTTATDARYAQLNANNTFTKTMTFASGQVFPGTAQLNVANTFTQPQTVNGTTSALTASASDPAGVGVAGLGNIGVEGVASTSGGVGIDGFGGSVGVAGSSNNTGGVGVAGGSSHGNGVQGISGGDTLNTAGVYGKAGNGTTFGGIAGVWGDADQHVGVFGSSNHYAGVIGESQSGYGVQAISNGADGVNAVSHTINGSGVAGINDAPGGLGVYGSSTNGGFGFYTDSNVAQSRGMGGWVKAMIFVDPFTSTGTAITRCYNSQASGATVWTPPCGIGILHERQGEDLIDFGFQVSDRYVSATAFGGSGMTTCVLDAHNPCLADGFFSPTDTQVLTDTLVGGGILADVAFWVIVF